MLLDLGGMDEVGGILGSADKTAGEFARVLFFIVKFVHSTI